MRSEKNYIPDLMEYDGFDKIKSKNPCSQPENLIVAKRFEKWTTLSKSLDQNRQYLNFQSTSTHPNSTKHDLK